MMRSGAPRVIGGPINRAIVRTYVDQILAPSLRKGDIAIPDNRVRHKAPAIRNAITAAGAKLFFLPACSPDRNPIGQVFAKRNHLLRKAAEGSKGAGWPRISQLLDKFSPKECKDYLRNSGYGSVKTQPAPTPASMRRRQV